MIYYVFWVAMLISIAASGTGTGWGRRAGTALLWGLALSAGVRGVRHMALTRAEGPIGYNAPFWAEDPAMAAVRSLPADSVLMSNAAGVVAFHTGREVLGYPRRWDSMTAQPLDGLSVLNDQLARIRDREFVLVYFSDATDERDEPLERVVDAGGFVPDGGIGRALFFRRASRRETDR